jgi:hypothetical protein
MLHACRDSRPLASACPHRTQACNADDPIWRGTGHVALTQPGGCPGPRFGRCHQGTDGRHPDVAHPPGALGRPDERRRGRAQRHEAVVQVDPDLRAQRAASESSVNEAEGRRGGEGRGMVGRGALRFARRGWARIAWRSSRQRTRPLGTSAYRIPVGVHRTILRMAYRMKRAPSREAHDPQNGKTAFALPPARHCVPAAGSGSARRARCRASS